MKLKDGTKVPGATTILKMLNKPYLITWANNLGKDGIDVNQYVNESAKQGTLMHTILESYVGKKEVDLSAYGEEDIKYAEYLFFNRFLPWAKEVGFKPIFSEKEFVSEENKFGGIIDAYGEIDGKKVLIDFKTSKQVYDEHLVQLVAYWKLLEENGIVVDKAIIINLKRETKEIDIKEIDKNFVKFEPYWELFKALVNVYYANKVIERLDKISK